MSFERNNLSIFVLRNSFKKFQKIFLGDEIENELIAKLVYRKTGWDILNNLVPML